MIDGDLLKDWSWTSAAVTVATKDDCSFSVKDVSYADNDCTRCWTEEGRVPYPCL